MNRNAKREPGAEHEPAALHWNRIWDGADPEALSWYQPRPTPSLGLIERGAPPPEPAVLDVGGGLSPLAGSLVEAGYRRVGVLDVSARGLERARGRVGERADLVEWIEADVRAYRPDRLWDVWHDRALLHFLTAPEERDAYRATLLGALSPGGCAVLATFGPEGPERCSGLPCRRYELDALAAFLGPDFEPEEHLLEDHRTPSGKVQQFLWARFRRRGRPAPRERS